MLSPREAVISVNKKIVIDAIGILLLALLIVIGYKLSPLLLPKADLTVQPVAGCDLNREACAAELPDGGRIELSSDVRPIPMVEPFHVELTVRGVQPSQVEVDFAGVDMNMGLNRPRLLPSGDGRFVGEVSLPVCVTGQMDWQVTVLIETARQRLAIPYRLSAVAAHGL